MLNHQNTTACRPIKASQHRVQADGQGALPLPRGFSPKGRILRFGFFTPSPLPAATAARQAKLDEEIAVMNPLTAKPWPQMRELSVRVGQNESLRAGSNGYSVPRAAHRTRRSMRIRADC
jgi:hypothetical protein